MSVPPLTSGALDVWHVDLAAIPERIEGVISTEERERAARFASAADGRLWARAHGLLRTLLGGYLDGDPSSLRFAVGDHGKPYLLQGGSPPRELQFNLSHSDGEALLAFSEGAEVGVDIEHPRPRTDVLPIAARIFGEEEAKRLEGLEPERRESQFLRAWVRHEARLKCLGTGIGAAASTESQASVWIEDLDLASATAAALAAARPPTLLRRLRFAQR